MRDDRGFRAEFLVAACVVAVTVCVEYELELAIAELLECGADLVGQRSELVVYDQDAVRSDGNADVAAGAFEHVNVAARLSSLDLNLGEIVLLGVDRSRCCRGYSQGQ